MVVVVVMVVEPRPPDARSPARPETVVKAINMRMAWDTGVSGFD